MLERERERVCGKQYAVCACDVCQFGKERMLYAHSHVGLNLKLLKLLLLLLLGTFAVSM